MNLHQLRIPLLGRLWFTRDRGEAVRPGKMVFASNLQAVIIRDGREIARRNLGSGLVTNAGVNLLAADWTNANATLKLMNYHDSGVGTTAAAVTDTSLQTQSGPATRATGAQSNLTNVYKTIATISYTTTLAITEWGLFTQAAQGGTMWDRRVFAALNVVNGDSISYTYSLTIASGG